jgi:hypothetical protein
MNATFFNNNSRAAQSGNTAVKKGTIPFLKLEQACFLPVTYCFVLMRLDTKLPISSPHFKPASLPRR